MHLWLSLPTAVESGMKRSLEWDVETVRTDGGNEVRNSRWSSPLRNWTFGYNNAPITSTVHAAVESLWRSSDGGTHTFNFTDERTGDTTRVYFKTPPEFTNTVGPYYHLDPFTVQEVRDTGPVPSGSAVISGTPKVGSTLTVSGPTFSGTPTITRQWLAGGAAINSATATTYVPVSGDIGKMIGCEVIATDTNGNATMVFAVEVGPVVA